MPINALSKEQQFHDDKDYVITGLVTADRRQQQTSALLQRQDLRSYAQIIPREPKGFCGVGLSGACGLTLLRGLVPKRVMTLEEVSFWIFI